MAFGGMASARVGLWIDHTRAVIVFAKSLTAHLVESRLHSPCPLLRQRDQRARLTGSPADYGPWRHQGRAAGAHRAHGPQVRLGGCHRAVHLDQQPRHPRRTRRAAARAVKQRQPRLNLPTAAGRVLTARLNSMNELDRPPMKNRARPPACLSLPSPVSSPMTCGYHVPPSTILIGSVQAAGSSSRRANDTYTPSCVNCSSLVRLSSIT